MIVDYNGKSLRITGELIFSPPIFYADLVSLKRSKEFSEEEKKEIIEFIINDSKSKIGTEVIFD